MHVKGAQHVRHSNLAHVYMCIYKYLYVCIYKHLYACIYICMSKALNTYVTQI